MDKITQHIDIVSNGTEHWIKFLQCPTNAYCVKTIKVAIQEMECKKNNTTPDPAYLIFTSTSNSTGEEKEVIERICENINTAEPRILSESFEADEMLIQPVGSDWNTGIASARIIIEAVIQEISIVPDESSFDWNFFQFRKYSIGIIYLNVQLRMLNIYMYF